MSTIKYSKLVRDRIPEIIKASGKNCVTELLSDDEYLRMIDAKLDEELDNDTMQKLTYSGILTWLTEIGMMEWALAPDGKRTKRPTKIGEETGISVEERTSSNGPYQVVVYNNAAQHFIIDNLDAILAAENMQTEMQGVPWAKEHDDCLIDLYKKSVPVSEIAIALKRSASAVRGRLKKLGFDA